MPPWQTPDRDQLTAKYLIRPFALMQSAWPPRSNRVSCAHAMGRRLPSACWGAAWGLGGAAWGCQPAPLLHTHPPSALTAPHAPASSPLLHTRVLHLLPHTDAHHGAWQQRRGCERPSQRGGQRGQPLRCFTTRRGSLSPMKYICGSARGDKLLNCVCGRFMVRREAGGRQGGRAAAALPQPAGPSRLRGRQRSPRWGPGGDHMRTQRE